MEIILLAAGGIIFVLSFFIPDRKGASSKSGGALSGHELKELVSQELESVRGHVDDVVEEAVSYAMEKTERSLERLSNEKIMAVNEYSDTVLTEIHKNHEETVFLYDMLNNKHTSLKNMVGEVNQAVKEAEALLSSLREAASGQESQEKRTAEARTQEFLPGENGFAEAHSAQSEASGAEPFTGNGGTGLPDGAEKLRESLVPQAENEQNNNEKILRLYRQGKSAVDIARELDLGVGEVKLVLDLFRT